MTSGDSPNEEDFTDLGKSTISSQEGRPHEKGPVGENLGQSNLSAEESRPQDEGPVGENLGQSNLSAEEGRPQDEGVVGWVEGQREGMRGILASILLGVLTVVIGGGLILVASDQLSIAELETISQVILTPLLTLVGSVVGFYFGGQTAQAAQSQAPTRAIRRQQRGTPQRPRLK